MDKLHGLRFIYSFSIPTSKAFISYIGLIGQSKYLNLNTRITSLSVITHELMIEHKIFSFKLTIIGKDQKREKSTAKY